VGATAGTASAIIGRAARRRRALHERGIDTDILGTYAKPVNEQGMRYFK